MTSKTTTIKPKATKNAAVNASTIPPAILAETPNGGTDMTKVAYFLKRPSLLIAQLPKNKREELAAHVGRRKGH